MPHTVLYYANSRLVDVGAHFYDSHDGYLWQYLMFANPTWSQADVFHPPTPLPLYWPEDVDTTYTDTTEETDPTITSLRQALLGITTPVEPDVVYNGHRSIGSSGHGTDFNPDDFDQNDWNA